MNKPDGKKKPAAWKKGWSRALSVESDRPIILHKAPWDQPETKKDSDERHSGPRD